MKDKTWKRINDKNKKYPEKCPRCNGDILVVLTVEDKPELSNNGDIVHCECCHNEGEIVNDGWHTHMIWNKNNK